MRYRVSKSCQTSGLDFIVKYEADVELRPADLGVEVLVLSTFPADAHPEMVEVAKESIRRGAESVLRDRGYGAMIRLSQLCIHDVDFSPRKFEQITADELLKAINSNPSASKPSD